ncbi:FHA domain-containing protein [Terrabacter sp. MAHUQ-38]|uniref:FHA domain-containing protein n=1 Tax=unclassified Terrabacter TaxID=2630222 RepID=UPI00165E0512|nr:FHA domain-containing protein [Terrabacter sp. MAHUQ-38]
MSGPSVVVDRAPDGWTHIGGPGMHLLIGLDEDDERTLAASDAADGGDIDDVVEVLTAGGMRKAHHFVGVHWQPRTRIVAFGPVAAVVTLADGTEHDVRAPSAKVWTDLELPEHPERVVLRVLDEEQRSAPEPPQTLSAASHISAVPGPDAASPATPDAAAPLAPSPVPSTDHAADDATADELAAAELAAAGAPAAKSSADAAPAPATASSGSTPAVPTFGAVTQSSSTGSVAPGSSGSSWGRSWAREPAAPSKSATGEPSASAALESATSDPSAPQGDPQITPAAPLPVDEPADLTVDVPQSDGHSGLSAAGEAGGPAVQDSSAQRGDGADQHLAPTPPETPAAQADSPPEPAVVPPTAPPAARPALRSWEAVAPAVPVRATVVPAAPAETRDVDLAPGVPARPVGVEWESAPAPAYSPDPVQPADPTVPATPTVPSVPETPVAGDLPAAAPPRDFESTWAARPVLETESAPPRIITAPASGTRTPAPGSTGSGPVGSDPTAAEAAAEADDEQPAVPPSYDYLFGHTTLADEHRKVLAQLGAPEDQEGAHEDDDAPAVPAALDTSDAPVTNAAPAPVVPPRPMPATPEVPEGGLISSVPWATSRPAPSVPKPEPDVPSFSGRHTPPPAPSLLPPMNTPPPGSRAPEATPLISTGPPPATPPPAPMPAPAPVSSEPIFDVPISTPLGTTPLGTTPSPTAPVAPYRPVTEPIPSGPAPTVDVGAGADEDETELTVDRSALLEARNAAQNLTFSGPSVLAVLCSAGHPTPPHSDRCRVCGAGIPPQEPFTMPRPPLGVLRLSTGDVVTLDRSVLLGRAPRLGDGLAAHDRPHVVKVPSPERDVSRNHVEVILEGWHVLIRDLGTTNGTTVTLPGEVPVRLRANDQQVLEPGSLVSMADEVSFTFEAAS